MENALNAAAGYYALTYAVFGNQMFTGYFSEQLFFDFEARPRWTVDERYFEPPDGADWERRQVLV